DIMDRVLGHRPASQAPVLIDTSADKNSNSDDELDSDDFQSSLLPQNLRSLMMKLQQRIRH
ncbi:MAG: hypothetical protein MJE68_03335, partial [Proteobacteria bacterium]|nr:hypothetical protein [Pseudomonadota bacterium]